MHDRCRILRWSGTLDAIGATVVTWTPDADEVRCGLGWAPRREAPDTDKTTVRGDYVLRLPSGTVIDARDRVQITTRFGEPLAAPEVYDVDGDPAVGPSGIVVGLVRADT